MNIRVTDDMVSVSRPAPRLVTVGECLALVSGTGVGGLEYGTQAEIGFGGAEGNVAICAARLGASAAWAGRVGDDAFGHRILRTLRGEGVTVFGSVDAHRATAMMLKESAGPGRTRVTYLRGGMAGSSLTSADIPTEFLSGATVLHVTGISLGLGGSIRDAVFDTVRDARARGTRVSFDVNHRTKLWADAAASSYYVEMARLADIVFAGEAEARLLLAGVHADATAAPGMHASPAEVARAVAELGPSEVVVKLGDQGIVACVDGELAYRGAIPVDVVDTVGAGDACAAGYLVELLNGAPLSKRIDTAVACGAFACLRSGDWESMPTRAQTRALLQAADPVDR